jgi:hypothetical protein
MAQAHHHSGLSIGRRYAVILSADVKPDAAQLLQHTITHYPMLTNLFEESIIIV